MAIPIIGASHAGARAHGCARQWRRGGVMLKLLCCAAALHLAFPVYWRHHGDCYATAATEPRPAAQRTSRRQSMMMLSSSAAVAAACGDSGPAEARGIGQELIRVDKNAGLRPIVYEKPAGFRQYASPIDPSSYIFRNVNDSYYSFISRAELKPNASTDFTPEQFIADYKDKFTNATGSSFALLSSTTEPYKVDKDLGIKYYQVEYVVRTQLGFAFDSLRSLHFLTVFAAAPESIYILNCQDQDDNWEQHKDLLKKVADSFAVVGEPAPTASSPFSFR